MTEVKNEKMNRVTVHLDEKPIYDIVKKHAPEYDADTITTEVLEARENEKV